jgi:hypothetical protein
MTKELFDLTLQDPGASPTVVAEINLKEFDNRSIVLNSYKVNSS